MNESQTITASDTAKLWTYIPGDFWAKLQEEIEASWAECDEVAAIKGLESE